MRRLLKTHPGYVALATSVLTLAVGINLLVFAIVNALWIRPLPIFEPDRVVTILQRGSTVTSLDTPRLQIFSGGVAGQVVTTGFNEAFKPQVSFPQVTGSLETLGVTPLYLNVLGVPIRGRAFTDADEQAGAEGVAIISDRLWSGAFGRRADVLGAVVAASPRPLRIVGIAPHGFGGARRGERADLWVPTRVVRRQAPGSRQLPAISMIVFARLAPGQTVASVERQYRDRLPPSGHEGIELPTFAPLTDVFGTSDSPTTVIRESGTFAVVSGLSLLVLLGGCSTIAALVLTHYERRRTELTLKLALGASSSQLVRELTSEMLLLAAAGSAGATVGELLGARVLPALSLPGGVNISRLDLSLDWRLCVVALVVALATLAVSGAVPIWRATRARLAGEVTTGSTARGSLRVRRGLLAFQVCATTVTLIASGLFVRTVLYSFRVAPGFDLDHTLFVSVQERSLLASPDVDPRSLALKRRAQLIGFLEQIPSVHDVAGGLPPISADALASAPLPRTIRTAGREERLMVGVLSGTPNLQAALGVPLLAGRRLEPSDATAAFPMPVVMTRSLAEQLWPTGDALGQTFSLPELRLMTCTVVGIAGDFAFGTLLRPITGTIVTARGDVDFRVTNLVLQADDPAAVVVAIQKHLVGRVVHVATGREVVAGDIAGQRLGAWVFSGFGVVALLLGLGGVFGLVSYLAQSRWREFGLRMALGATFPELIRYAVTMALGPVAAGVVAGLLVAAFASRLFTATLVGVQALDSVTYASVGVGTLGCATLAALSAAWRLRRTTPSDALRSS